MTLEKLLKNRYPSPPPFAYGIAHGSLAVVAVGSLVAGAVLHPSLYIVFGVSLIAHIPLIFLRTWLRPSGSSRGLNSKAARITDAQVFALIDKRRPTLTPRRLASATNSTEEAAAEKLTFLAREGYLRSEVPEDSYEVHYRKRDDEGRMPRLSD